MVKQYFKMKLLHIICVIMTSSLLLVNPATSSTCSNPIPNLDLDKMLEGVDITEVDPFPVVNPTSQKSKDNILAFTCVNGRKWWDVEADTEYNFPDEIRYPQARCTERRHVDLLTTNGSVTIAMSREAGTFPKYQSFTSAHTNSQKKLKSDVNTKSTLIVNSIVRLQDTAVYFQTINMSSEAEAYIAANLTGSFKSNRGAYLEFVEKYGTHYRGNGIFGGAVRNYMEIEKSYSSNVTETELKRLIKLNFDETLGEYPNKDVTAAFKNGIKKQHVIYYGGSDTLKNKASVKDWRRSTKQNPYFYSSKLTPIYNLVSDVKTRKEIKEAVDFHLTKKLFTDSLKQFSIFKRMSAEHTNELIDVLATRSNLSSITSHGALVSQISNELTIPTWFKTDLRLCFAMYGDATCSNKTQCGPINYRLKSFIDNIGQGSKCHMKWKVKASGSIPKYFQDTQMCLKYEAGVGKPCTGNVTTGRMCAPVNQFLTIANNSQGNCKAVWSVHVPAGAPAWLKAVHEVLLPMGKKK